jgi:hypothetical protein
MNNLTLKYLFVITECSLITKFDITEFFNEVNFQGDITIGP